MGLRQLGENIQDDLICLLESQFGEVEYIDEVKTLACQLVIDRIRDFAPPGSPEAKQLGCKCPTMDNAYGKGVFGLGKDWVVSGDCKVHNTGPVSNRAAAESEEADGD